MSEPVSRSLFAGLLQPCVAVAQGLIGEIAGVPWPEEAASVARAVETRRAEFVAGRALARQALAALGQPGQAIPAGPDRAPLWPAGFTGSIAHSRRRAVAAVARLADIRSVGIDIEDASRFHPRLESHILRPSEILANLSRLDPDQRRMACAILFSAKEAFYKCQYTLSRARLGFHDAETRLDSGRFRLTLLVPAPPFAIGDAFEGRYAVSGDLVAAAMVLT